ncbi:MAG: hypothetical protein JXN61_09545 [Sedimentisphaerales bacterium]|nr:hypothetical protein [Sedimentisphaerales bacterium]
MSIAAVLVRRSKGCGAYPTQADHILEPDFADDPDGTSDCGKSVLGGLVHRPKGRYTG